MMVRTDCIERVLRKFFQLYSRVLWRYPVWFCALSVLVTLCLGTGFAFFSYESSTDTLFTPIDSQARLDQDIVRDLFPDKDDQFVPDRNYGDSHRQLSVLIYTTDGDNLLRWNHVQEIIEVNSRVLSMNVGYNGSEHAFHDICSTLMGDCLEEPILRYLRSSQPPTDGGVVQVPYPIINEGGLMRNIEGNLGGTETGNGFANSAKLILVSYFVENSEVSELWESAIVARLSSTSDFSEIQIAVFPSDGLDEASRSLTRGIVPYFSITYSVLITFAITSCVMFRDSVQSKPWLASMGVLSASMAVVSALGLLSYCGVPFNQVATSVPFLVLGIGLDDMFILLSAWRSTIRHPSVGKRLEETLKDAGVSITITTLTDVLAFLVGSISPLPAIKVFCLYAGVAVLFDFVYQLTFFGAFLVIFGNREERNLHSWTCLKVRPRGDPQNSGLYDAFCAGGRSLEPNEKIVEHLGITFFKRVFTKLFQPLGILMIAILYIIYIGVSVWGFLNIEEGLELKNLAEQGSPSHIFLEQRQEVLQNIGPSVSVVFTTEINYWEEDVQTDLKQTMENFESNYYVKGGNSTQCWFVEFYRFLDNNGQNDFQNGTFLDVLRNDFLHRNPQFRIDINFSEDSITASRCVIVTANAGSAKEQGDLMLDLRKLASDSSTDYDIEVLVYAPEFIFFEQFIIIIPQTIQVLGVAVATMLLVSILLIPNPLVAILVTLSVASILFGVTGLMTFWGVSLESVSLINLVLCIGFSIDFAAHVAYTFVASDPAMSPKERLSFTFGRLGYPLLQSAISTILGVIILIFYPSYIFQTFGKIIVLVMFIGLLHGLFFVPAVMYSFSQLVFKCKSRGEEELGQSRGGSRVQGSHTNKGFSSEIA